MSPAELVRDALVRYRAVEAECEQPDLDVEAWARRYAASVQEFRAARALYMAAVTAERVTEIREVVVVRGA